jgi:hypothetical protein
MLITQHYFMAAMCMFLIIVPAVCVHCLSLLDHVYAAEEAVDPRVAHFVAVHGPDTDDPEIDEYTAASAAAYASYMDNAIADDSADDDDDDDEQPESPEPEPAEVNGECWLFIIMLSC